MNWKYIAYLTVFFLIAIACEKEPERFDDFLVELATVVKPGEQISFQLDNNKTLIPRELKNYSGKDGQRVALNYTPLRGDTIKVNNVSDIFTGTVQESNAVDSLIKNPVKIQSVWVSGNYLNLILEIEYYEKAHTIGLFRDTQSSSLNLHLAYSRNDDPPGYAKKLYTSFLLSALKSANGSPTPFRLHINTYAGERIFELEVK
ncbi:MAG: NigD-like C-terminal domain-containing protein [Bacteroidia bacterium]|nr:NigD-like C-terminal domain-containing protein [Bacteroidia bacterium]